MAYRKLGRESRIRRSILAGLTKDVINHGFVVTTEARAKEARKFIDKMITYGKNGSLVSPYYLENKKCWPRFINAAVLKNLNISPPPQRVENVVDKRA